MNSLLVIFSSIIVIFFIALLIKSFLSLKKQKNFCAICIAISLTWFIFLIASWFNLFNNKIILAILMGQSSSAIFYILEKNQALQFFKLPLVLALTLIPYSLINPDKDMIPALLLFIALTIAFSLILALKINSLKPFIKKIIECCKKW